ncbi:MAG: Holliday junction branch migration protein RuvA [Candidatus Binatales bacterium]
MIASLSGRVRSREAGRVLVETGGVGYEVFIPLSTYYRLPSAGEVVTLEIRQVVREDSLALYGFSSAGEKRAFDVLLGVQHVGPKLALAILSVLSPGELVAAIQRGDADRIDAVPGVGPKVAERVVRELKDKAADLKLIAPAADDGDRAAQLDSPDRDAIGTPADDAISALINLGYKPSEAKRAVDSVTAAGGTAAGGSARVAPDLEVIIRRSLAILIGEK